MSRTIMIGETLTASAPSAVLPFTATAAQPPPSVQAAWDGGRRVAKGRQ